MVPFDAKAAEKAVRAWVSAANNGRFIEVDTSRCVSRYQQPKGDWPVTVKTLRQPLGPGPGCPRTRSAGYITDVDDCAPALQIRASLHGRQTYNRQRS